jgi:hypothetical protein
VTAALLCQRCWRPAACVRKLCCHRLHCHLRLCCHCDHLVHVCCRRDGCPAVSKMLEACLRTLFTSRDLSAVKDYCTRQWAKILSNRVSVQVGSAARSESEKYKRPSSGYQHNLLQPLRGSDSCARTAGCKRRASMPVLSALVCSAGKLES